MYGPAVDNDFATNKWVYLYYAPPTVTTSAVRRLDRRRHDADRQRADRPRRRPVRLGPVERLLPALALQVRRRQRQHAAAPGPRLRAEDHAVANNRGACCHVGGDIDFDKHNNLWLVTGDDTPAGGGNSGGFSPHNDKKTDESQTVRVTNATGGTFTLTFNGQTTAPIAYNATARRDPGRARGAVQRRPRRRRSSPAPTRQHRQRQTIAVPRPVRAAGRRADHADAAGLTGHARRPVAVATTQQGTVQRAVRRRAPLGAQHERPARQGAAHQGQRRRLATRRPAGTCSPSRGRRRRDPPGDLRDGLPQPVPDPGRRERRRLRDGLLAGLAASRENFRGPAGTGRVEIVRKPANYGWPLCYAPDLPYYQWNFNTSTPLDPPRRSRTSAATRNRGPAEHVALEHRPGTVRPPPITQPDIWYSYRDNADPPLGTPCLAYYDGSGGTVPAALPRAVHGRRRSARRGAVRLRPGQPEPDEVPAVLRRRRSSSASSRRTRCARSGSTPGQPDPQDQPVR